MKVNDQNDLEIDPKIDSNRAESALYPPGQKAGPRTGEMARPMDRLAAFIVDLVFLLPIIQIAQAPWVSKLKSLSLIGETSIIPELQMFLNLVSVFVFISYRFGCHFFFKKTLGKKILGLEVEWEEKTFLKCLMRPIVLLIECVFFFIPLAAVMTHHRRRTLHDRICDSYVVGHNHFSRAPEFREIYSAKLMQGVLCIVGVLVLSKSFLELKSPEESMAMEIEADVSCELYSEIYDGSMASVLEAFALKQVDEACLSSLSQVHVWEDSSPLLSYIGLALAFKNQAPVKAKSYQKELCADKKNSAECEFLSWQLSEQEIPKDEVLHQMASSSHQPNFYQIFVLDTLLESGENEKANELLTTMAVSEQNKGFIETASVYNLLHLKKWDSAFWVFQTSDLDESVLVDFFQDAIAESRIPKKDLLDLVERFYPELSVKKSSRWPARNVEVPAKIQVLWQNLGG